MKKHLSVKILSVMTAVFMTVMSPLEALFFVPAGSEFVYAAEGRTGSYTRIEISTADDLLELERSCHDEAWSADKYVVLKNNISLAGSEFTSIPIFSGYFNGNGFTISGYTYGGTGYVSGFFRYIGSTATIDRLNISGDISCAEEGYVSGLLAGINEGRITDCSVSGVISGNTATGGIAGINGNTGLITGCRNNAVISGFYYTGGVAGRNYGVIKRSVNAGTVNATPEWVSANDERQVDIISEITGDVSLISYQSGVDTGGIAGFSRGLIVSSRNESTVGYERVGYNVGGICGRHSGVIYDCSNYGRVYGKKDIGGITGQQEPYIEIDRSKSVSDAIAEINAMARRTAQDASGMTPDIQAALSDLQTVSGKAMDDAEGMTGDYSRYRIEERDWAGMIEREAENAGRAAAESVRNTYEEHIGDFDSYTGDDIDDLITDIEGGLSGDGKDGTDEAEEHAREQLDNEKNEAAAELNGTVNGAVSDWNSGIDTLSANTELLTGDLNEIRKAADSLIAVSNAYSTKLTADLTAINDRINATYDLIDDLITGVEEEGVDYLFSDVSEMDLPDDLYGRTISCRNFGTVSGDLNTGGVAGCLSVDTENIESNVLRKFDLKTGEGSAISSVIYDCENSGIVIVRTDCGGGITGEAEHGCIRNCRGYGAVTSEEGDHIGGIAGSSEGSIVSSYVLCTLSGRQYVGGVAGYATAIKNCVSMPVFGNVSGVCGGVAGQILRDADTESIDRSDYTSNYFVADDFYGIDDISYSEIAQEIGYDDVLMLEDIPSEFSDLKVTFVSDGTILKVCHMNYGDSLDSVSLPAIRDREGSYGVWPDLTGMTVRGNLVIEAGYVSHVAVIRSAEETDPDGKPLALIQGEFRSSDQLSVRTPEMTFEAPDNSAYTDLLIYEVCFSGNDFGEDSGTGCDLRLYAPFKECRVWKRVNDIWTEIPCSTEGSYVQIRADSASAVYAVTETPDETMKSVLYAFLAVTVLVFLIIFIRQVRKVWRKQSQKP